MEILRKELKIKGMTIGDLAKKLSVSETAIYLWIAGTYLPKAVHVKKMIDFGFSEDAAIEPFKEV